MIRQYPRSPTGVQRLSKRFDSQGGTSTRGQTPSVAHPRAGRDLPYWRPPSGYGPNGRTKGGGSAPYQVHTIE